MLDETVKTMRSKSGMTINQISDKSNVPKSTVSRFFVSPDTSPYQTVQAIVEAMGYTMADLCGGTPEERQRYTAAVRLLLAEKDRRIQQLGKWLRRAVIYSVSVTGILIGFSLYDVLNPTVGWLRQHAEAAQGMKGSIL